MMESLYWDEPWISLSMLMHKNKDEIKSKAMKKNQLNFQIVINLSYTTKIWC